MTVRGLSHKAKVTEMHRVLCSWGPGQCPEVIDSLKGIAEVEFIAPEQQILHDRIADCDVYLAGLAVRLDGDMIQRADRLKLVATASTGLDHLDLQAMEERGVELICIRDEVALLDEITATAELAWALLLAAVRKLPAGHAAAMQGEWARDRLRGHQLSGKTVGILGVGRLGRMMVDYARAFRMNVIGCDPNPLRPIEDLEYVDFPTLLRRSDVISVHVHLTPQTRHMLDAAAFSRMADGVVIVNTSRGAVIEEQALVAALESGKVGAAGLDVIDGEWRTDLRDHPLIRYAREHNNLVISPHLGGVTYESQAMALKFTADKVADWIRQQRG